MFNSSLLLSLICFVERYAMPCGTADTTQQTNAAEYLPKSSHGNYGSFGYTTGFL